MTYCECSFPAPYHTPGKCGRCFRPLDPELPPLSEACEVGRHYDCGEYPDDCTCPCHDGEDE